MRAAERSDSMHNPAGIISAGFVRGPRALEMGCLETQNHFGRRRSAIPAKLD